MEHVDMIIQDAAQLMSMSQACDQTGPVSHGALAIHDKQIIKAGSTEEIQAQYTSDHIVDATNKVLTPGLVDSHTHLVFGPTREHEFEMRIQGASYMDIAQAGGGINSTVKQVRATSKERLKELARMRASQMLAHGTTTVEAKSGYGLNIEDEVKTLEIANELHLEMEIDIVPTFLGAHDIPPEYKGRSDDYIDFVIKRIMPVVADHNLARYCDVFCEDGVFSIEQSRTVLEAGKTYGMRPRFHADEFVCLDGAVLAAEVGAASADHLLVVSDKGISAMKQSNVVASLLPGTSFFLGGHQYAPARKMIDQGLTVALSTDFNPGSCMSFNLQMIMTIACTQMNLSPYESLLACTRNGAISLEQEHRIGTLEEGKEATFVIWNVDDYRKLSYHFGLNHVHEVYVRGHKIQ